MSTETGRHAEQRAAVFLQEEGHHILAKNWRTRWCEIDLITRCADIVYFVEVKYRQTTRQGAGLDYITPKKLAQMHFAAEFWRHMHRSSASNYQLAAIEVTGSNFDITAWLDDL